MVPGPCGSKTPRRHPAERDRRAGVGAPLAGVPRLRALLVEEGAAAAGAERPVLPLRPFPAGTVSAEPVSAGTAGGGRSSFRSASARWSPWIRQVSPAAAPAPRRTPGASARPGSGSLPPSRRTRPPGRCGRARRRRGERRPARGSTGRPYSEWAMPFDGARGARHPGGVEDLRRGRPDRDDGVPGHRRVPPESVVGGGGLPVPSTARAFRPGRSNGAPAAAEGDAAAAGGAGEARRLGCPDLRPPPAAAPPAARRGIPRRGEVVRRTGSSN